MKKLIIVALLSQIFLFNCTNKKNGFTNKDKTLSIADYIENNYWEGIVVYERSMMKQPVHKITAVSKNGMIKITNEDIKSDTEGMMMSPFDEEMYIDFVNKKLYSYHIFKDGECLKIEETFAKQPKMEYTGQEKEIMGYTCKEAIRYDEMYGEKYESKVWIAKDTKIKGSPNFVGAIEGLVMEVNSGNMVVKIKEIIKKPINSNEIKLSKIDCKKSSNHELMEKIQQNLMNKSR